MGGRVKLRSIPSLPTTIPAGIVPISRLAVRAAADTAPPPADSTVVALETGAQHISLDKSSIIWLSVLSVVVLASVVVIAWLLFRCHGCRKGRRYLNGHRHHPSLEVNDGRNQFDLWNRNARHGARLASDASVIPLTAMPTVPAVVHPGNPVVIDEAPVYNEGSARANGRYYSGLGGALKRWSSVGRAR